MGLELFIGADESNNGRALEVHTTVFSFYSSDIVRADRIMPKIRQHRNLNERPIDRGYSFLLFTDSDKHRTEKSEKLGIITSSLLYEELDFDRIDKMNIYFDGNKCKNEIKIAGEMISDKLKILPEKIHMFFGPKFDQYYPIVNIADQLAHHLFKRPTYILSEHKNRKKIIWK